jgi:hypothetical protein
MTVGHLPLAGAVQRVRLTLTQECQAGHLGLVAQ